MDELTLKANAKINLILDIVGTYPDGYHALDMIAASADIADVVFARKSTHTRVVMQGRVCGEENTAFRALRALESAFGITLDVRIEKGIPMSAGLGGSSADASAAFAAASLLYGIALEDTEPLALKTGADCVYMLRGGGARVSGKGELVQPIALPRLSMVVAQKSVGASTKAVYGQWDASPSARVDVDAKLAELLRGKGGYYNALTDAACALCPEIADLLARMRALTPYAFMTGSGSAVAGVFENDAAARRAAERLRGDCAFCCAAHTVDRGIEVI